MSKIFAGFKESEAAARKSMRSGLGSLVLLSGLALLGLRFAESEAPLPFRMPRSWYSDGSLWVAAGVGALIGGWILLKDDEPARERETLESAEPFPIPRFRSLRIYTRAGCHLCEAAGETLEKYGDALPDPELVDIDSDPILAERFGGCVPVVELDGKVRFRGRVNEVLLRRLIAATPPLGPCGPHCCCHPTVSIDPKQESRG